MHQILYLRTFKIFVVSGHEVMHFIPSRTPMHEVTNKVTSLIFLSSYLGSFSVHFSRKKSVFSGGLSLITLHPEFFKNLNHSLRPRETVFFHQSDGEAKKDILIFMLFPLILLLQSCYWNWSYSHDWSLLPGCLCWSRFLSLHVDSHLDLKVKAFFSLHTYACQSATTPVTSPLFWQLGP